MFSMFSRILPWKFYTKHTEASQKTCEYKCLRNQTNLFSCGNPAKFLKGHIFLSITREKKNGIYEVTQVTNPLTERQKFVLLLSLTVHTKWEYLSNYKKYMPQTSQNLP